MSAGNGSGPRAETIRVAAIQPRLEVGAVEANLERVEGLVRDAAREHSPDVILLPEAITSPNAFGSAMLRVARPVDGAPYELLGRLAAEFGCMVGGGYIASRGAHTRGTYVLREADGSAHLHDKDQPTMWEHNYYAAGADDGICSTGLGRVGVPMGFEWARTRTAARLRGRVDLVLGGSCWWSYPDWPPARLWFRRDHDYNLAAARAAPGRMARAVGAPAAVAQHVGDMRSGSPLMPGIPYSTVLVGETHIVDRDGAILASMSYADGEGHIAADVAAGASEPADPLVNGFWMSPMPNSLHAVWHLYNSYGRAAYALRRARGAFEWQSGPDRDLPGYVPGAPVELPEERVGSAR